MNRLQKSAVINLVVTASCVLIAGLGFAVLTQTNVTGAVYLLIFFVFACLTMPVFFLLYRRWAAEAGFDEREKMIYRRAFILSTAVGLIYLAGICIVPFFVLGGGSVVRVYYLPLVFLSTILTMQFTPSLALLIQCQLEETHEQS
jgi:hypothetical protein